MTAFQITFYLGAALMLIFALLSVTSRKLLRSAIYLLAVLVGVAIFYLLVDYMFLAAVQVVVYLGGIVVLIIFSILLTSHISEKLEIVKPQALIISALVVLIGAGAVISTVSGYEFKTSDQGVESTISIIGTKLLSYEKYGYVLPFEVISILLLASMVAAIVIAKREKKDNS